MGWFGRRQNTLVPAELLDQLGELGGVVWQAKVTGQPITDPRFGWDDFYLKMIPAYESDFPRAIAEVHTAAGDDPLAKIGGYKLIAEFEPDTKDPMYLDMMDTLLRLMAQHGVSQFWMTGYERDRWGRIS